MVAKKKKTRGLGLSRWQLLGLVYGHLPGYAKILQAMALEELAVNEEPAESVVLEVLRLTVTSRQEVDAVFQSIANAIIAKATLLGKLPKRMGRPEAEPSPDGFSVAIEYFRAVDKGTRSEDAVAAIAENRLIDTRTVYRIVKQFKSLIGDTAEGRAPFLSVSNVKVDLDFSKFKIEDDLDPVRELEAVIQAELKNRSKANAVIDACTNRWISDIASTDK